MTEHTAPAGGAFAITPNDSTDLTRLTRGLYVGVGGNVAVRIGGVDVTFSNLAAGVVHPLRVTRVLSTGTTATNIVGLI